MCDCQQDPGRFPRAGHLAASATLNPLCAVLGVAVLDRGPRNAMRGFLLAGISAVGGEGVIESLPVDVLRVVRQVVAN